MKIVSKPNYLPENIARMSPEARKELAHEATKALLWQVGWMVAIKLVIFLSLRGWARSLDKQQ